MNRIFLLLSLSLFGCVDNKELIKYKNLDINIQKCLNDVDNYIQYRQQKITSIDSICEIVPLNKYCSCVKIRKLHRVLNELMIMETYTNKTRAIIGGTRDHQR